MNYEKLTILLCVVLMMSCDQERTVPPLQVADLTTYADPMVGTDAHGHTFPGATVPHGMVQLSPSNGLKGWDWSSGYHYSDSVLKGFAHNHISGPGLSGLGDILLMPTSKLQTRPGTDEDPDSGYRSRFSHDTETAEPGYYSVLLEDEAIRVELTSTLRVGFHRYTFETAGEKFVIFDPTHSIGEFAYETSMEVLSDNQIRGYKKSKSGTAGDRTVYFLATFSRPLKDAGITQKDEKIREKNKAGEEVKGYAAFDVDAGESIEVQVAISHVNYEGAEKNWKAEGENKTFDEARLAAKEMWQEKLSKIVVKEDDLAKKRTFYSAMYHSFISPNLISDVDGKYYLEGKVRSSNIPQFSNYSTWDTYRALHPLLTIIEQKKSADFVNSMVSRYADEGLILPGWEAQGFDNVCMIGYNMTSPIADAVLKDIAGIDHEKAYAAIKAAAFDRTKNSPNYDVNGMDGYLKYGFVTAETGSSVSKTTEQNYYDWAIARVAEKLGKVDDAKLFDLRSKGWRSFYDPASGYLFPKKGSGELVTMDTTTWNGLRSNYVSGNIWAYSAYTPHDMKAAIQIRGGRKKYLDWLGWIFENDIPVGGEQHVDISGFIGKYGHGDEPGHQMPYLFTVAGQPWKTQQYVNEVMTTMYSDQPDGLINNEDLGQMSAWYIFSALGFYPLAPGDLVYQLGAPLYEQADLRLENGNIFSVVAKNQANENIYVQKAWLNGKAYNKTYITHETILEGGTLEFEMGSTPNKNWGTAPSSSFLGEFDDTQTVEIPGIGVWAPNDRNPGSFFEEIEKIELVSNTEGAKIFYTLDGSEPSSNALAYTAPIEITADTKLKAIAFKEGLNPSTIYERNYFQSFLSTLKEGFPKVTAESEKIAWGKDDCSMIFDQYIGTESYSDGKWTGLKGDLVLNIDLGEIKTLKEVIVGYLSDTGVWIFPPDKISVFGGISRSSMQLFGEKNIAKLDEHTKLASNKSFSIDEEEVRHLKIHIKEYGPAPSWHGAGPGEKMWLFIDEIILK